MRMHVRVRIYTHIFFILLSHINNCRAETCPVYTRAGKVQREESNTRTRSLLLSRVLVIVGASLSGPR
jgi:hypothetical protein